MKLLVTGGAGFIGSHFVDYILEKYSDYEVVNLDALTYAGNKDNLKNAMPDPRHQFVHGRIEDAALVGRLVPRVDAVINFAAETHVDRSITGPQAFIQSNVEGTLVLLEAAHEHQTGLYFQISTDEVYGPSMLDARDKNTEDARLNPISPYAASKAAADLLVLAYHRTFGLPVVISRCTNNYGSRQNPEKFLPTVILNAFHDRPIPVYGDGQYMRDWIHVQDHCRAIDMILHRGRKGEIYNIAPGNEWLNIDIVRKILKLMGKPEKLISFVTDRPGHDKRYTIDAGKIRQELQWQAEVPWEKGLRELIAWYTGEGAG